MRNLDLASQISLGIGAAAIGTTTFLYFQLNSGSDKSAMATARYGFEFAPWRTGAVATLSGAY